MSRFALKKKSRQKSKQAAFHPGPVLPPSGEGSHHKTYFVALKNSAGLYLRPVMPSSANGAPLDRNILSD